jgi:TPR repeat protein
LLLRVREMTANSCRAILLTLAAHFILTAPVDTLAAGPRGQWVDVVAAYDRGDYATARLLLRALAEKGDADAQYDLGALYHAGEDLPPDYVQAYKWYDIAASRFTASEQSMRDRAVKNRDRVAAMMTPAQIEKARKLAREWTPGK